MHRCEHRSYVFATFSHSLFLPQVLEQRKDLACNSFDLTVALLVRADEVERDMANACRVKRAHTVGDLLCRAEGGIAFSRLAKVHGIAVAQ